MLRKLSQCVRDEGPATIGHTWTVFSNVLEIFTKLYVEKGRPQLFELKSKYCLKLLVKYCKKTELEIYILKELSVSTTKIESFIRTFIWPVISLK